MRSRRAATTASLLAAAIAIGVEGAPAAQGLPPVAQPEFRSGVQLVEVDVRVFDAQGRFVADLRHDEFELVESGVPQTIDAVHRVGVETPPSAPALDSAGGSAAPEPRQTWVFMFDLNHLSPGGFDRARKAVEEFVRDRLHNGHMAGIVAGDRMINNRFTSLTRELLEAVRQLKPRAGNRMRLLELTHEWPRVLDYEEAIRIARNEHADVARAVSRACADDPDFCGRGADPEALVRAKATRVQQEVHGAAGQVLAAMNGLASGLARMPGPKTVVVLSEGFVIHDMASTLRSVVGQTSRAGARVYAIDVRGLNRTANPGVIEQTVADDVFDAGLKFDTLADGPNSLAVDTGGLIIRNENNLGRALDRVAEDSGRYYVLAYRPVNATLDGAYRPIEVRVKRHNARVRARRGYLALEPARMLVPAPVATANDPRPLPAASTEPLALEPPEPAASAVADTARGVTAPADDAKPPAGVRLRPGAESRVEALSSRESGSSSALAARGWEAYQRGDVETARAAFLQAAAETGVRPWILYALGLSQAALGDTAAAVASWERVRQAAPDFQPVYLDLADGYAALSNLTSALATVRQAEARWPTSPEVHSAIGVILVRRGALDAGIRSLITTTELDASDDLAFLNLGRAYALRYQGSRRYVTSQRRWVAREDDRKMAIEALQRCVKLAGPYATQAKEELTLLQWSVRQ